MSTELPPKEFLQDIREEHQNKGRLKIFFGYAAGVGKTYAMLDDAQEQFRCGADVLVGYVDPHTRPETLRLLQGLPVLPTKEVAFGASVRNELDLDEAIKRKPELILVDELAHANAEGLRNKKRYQDIEELLNAGIDVYTTVNVEHIESLKDVVQDITKMPVEETAPDFIFDQADKVELIDMDPEELLKRFEEGRVYSPEGMDAAKESFFTRENLPLLREIAMRKVADRLSHDNQNEKRLSGKMANIKLLVCIGPSLSFARCIRWTARMAEALHSPWTAVYVQDRDSENLSDEQNRAIRLNMDLAEKLGAEIVTLNGYDIAATVAEYAKLSGITNIVVGKSRHKSALKRLFEMDFEDKLIFLMPSIEVHILFVSPSNRLYRKRKQPSWTQNFVFSWPDTLKTLGLFAAATLASFSLRALGIGDKNIVMAYILSVLLVSRFTAGYAYGIIASVLSVLAFDFLFIYPYLTFEVLTEYPITFLIMLLVALITSTLTARIKAEVRLAVERERRTEVLYEINKKLLATRGLENIVALTNEYIVKLFGRSVVFYTEDPAQGESRDLLRSSAEEDASFLYAEEEKAAAHWVFANQKPAGSGTDTLTRAEAYYLPAVSQGKTLGVLGVSCRKSPLDHNRRLFLRMIASQVAMALERQYLSDEQRRILMESEKEKMRSNLLRAISHDLRTPLTGILGASSAILENEGSFDKSTCDQLIFNIKEDAQWLIRLVENLLSVTRIHEGSMNVAKTPEAAEEIVAEAISRTRKRFPECNISVNVPGELLMVPMDGTLIMQVLLNLLENAVKHSIENSLIEVEVRKEGDTAVFEVRDSGMGIDEQELPYLFDGYISGKKRSLDSLRGMGIGLSICKSVIKAHNGKIEAANRKTGGAVLLFTLPLEGNADNG